MPKLQWPLEIHNSIPVPSERTKIFAEVGNSPLTVVHTRCQALI